MAEKGNSAVIYGLYMAHDMGDPMISCGALMAVEGRGLSDPINPDIEDRYASGKGAWSQRPPKPNASREISLFPWEALEQSLQALRDATGSPSLMVDEFALLTRRNVGIKGFGPDLSHLEGCELHDPETGLRILVTNSCKPCDRPGRLAAKLDKPLNGIDLRELLPDNRAGMRARTIQTGLFMVNHTLTVV